MIESLLTGLFKTILNFVIATLAIILSPIYALLTMYLPYGFSDFTDSLNNFFNMIIAYIPFVADLTFIPLPILKLLIDYIIFKLVLKFTIMSVKYCVKWYNALKG